MTSWNPQLEGRSGPVYISLAEAIAEDVRAGRLSPGTRLPTHRDLAKKLRITVGTVTRGYGEAFRRGLLTGEVGRGTFVRGPRNETPSVLRHDPMEPGIVDLSHNVPNVSIAAEAIRAAIMWVGRRMDPGAVLQYQPHVGSRRHRESGASFIGRLGIDTNADDIVLTGGAQHAMLLALSTNTEPGDAVLCESVTYPGMKAVAAFLRLRLEGVAMDEFGMRPDALDEACRKHRAKVVYILPTLQNPTARVMPELRRKDIAAVTKKHNMIVIEDDLYGFLASSPPPPLVRFTDPERSFFLTSVSKCIAPSLRVGYMRSPRARIGSLANAIVTTTHMASPLCAEIVSILFEEGSLDSVIKQHRADIKARQTIAREELGRFIERRASAEGFHLWLQLPGSWSAGAFAAHARTLGVGVAPSEDFAVGRGNPPCAVRVSVSAAPSLDLLRAAARKLHDALIGTPAAKLTARV